MAKEFRGEELPHIPAQQGNPDGVKAEDDVVFKEVRVVKKGEYYSKQYLDAVDEGCAVKKPPPAEVAPRV